MFGYNTLGFGSIAGTAGPLDLDLTVQGAQVNRANGTYTGVSIGTANTNRMVVLQGATNAAASNYTAPTSITINGTAMTRVSNLSSFIAWAKVPTGTTATIVISGGTTSATGYATRIITFNTINTTASQTSVQSVNVPSGTVGSVTMTTNPVATDGVFIWAGTNIGGGPSIPTFSVTSNNPSGATGTLTGVTAQDQPTTWGAYSTCSTADSRFARLTLNNSSGSKSQATIYGSFTYFQAN